MVIPFEKVYGKKEGEEEGKKWGLIIGLLTFVGSLLLWVGYESDGSRGFQYVEEIEWIKGYPIRLGVDGISMYFMILTTLLVPICILGVWEVEKEVRRYIGSLLIMEGLIIGVFMLLDMIGFYVCFEGVLIPMYMIIGKWGGRERKIKAGYYLFLYTLLGSIMMLLGILMIYWEVGTLDYQGVLMSGVQEKRQYVLWVALFVAFAVKVPMVPVHIWLPEAHVEAPTVGSVILAGVLLKLGTYGMIRYGVPLMSIGTGYYRPGVYMMSMIGIVYTSMTAIRQTDMKRIIAYASVAHMSMTVIGLYSKTPQGYSGSILQMLSHGIVSGALFICVGVLYDRYKSRKVKEYSGVVHIMPIYSVILMLFTMANIGLPGTSSFVGEFMILVGIYQVNMFVGAVSALTMVLGGGYSLWLYNRISYGNSMRSVGIKDVSRREMGMLMPLIVITVVMGVYPSIWLENLTYV